jgi:hypothetical protein
MHKAIVIICFVLGLISWEHIVRTVATSPFRKSIRPSIIFNYVVEIAQHFFEELGKMWAIVCSFLTLIDLQEIKITLADIFVPLINSVFSPFYFFAGFNEKAMSYMEDSGLIYLGSFLLSLLLLWSVYKLSGKDHASLTNLGLAITASIGFVLFNSLNEIGQTWTFGNDAFNDAMTIVVVITIFLLPIIVIVLKQVDGSF